MKNKESVLYKMRTLHDSQMRSLMSRTDVVRIVKFFPNNTNQGVKKVVMYNRNSSFLHSFDFTYGDIQGLREILPKRISVIEDEFNLKKLKDFIYYEQKCPFFN